MPKITHVTKEIAVAERAAGLSVQQIAARYKVSISTVKRFFRKEKPDGAVLEFTKKIELLIGEVPDEYCARELRRMVNVLRTERGSPHKYQLITRAIQAGAAEAEEIAEDCFIAPKEAAQLLGEMIEGGLIEKYRRRASGEAYYRLTSAAPLPADPCEK